MSEKFIALFSGGNLKTAADKGIRLIARMHDNTLIVKSSIEEAASKLGSVKKLTLENARGEAVIYRIL